MLPHDPTVQVHYLAVAREKDETIIASKVSQCFDDEKEKAEAFKTDIKVVLRAPDYNFNTTLDSLYRISQDSSCNFIRRANGSAFFAITANEYPEDKCKLLLDDVVDAFQAKFESRLETAGEEALSAEAAPMLDEMMRKHGTTCTKVEQVEEQVNTLKEQVANNVTASQQNKEHMECVAEEAEKSRQALQEFEAKTRKLKRIYRRRRLFAYFVALIVAALIGLGLWAAFGRK